MSNQIKVGFCVAYDWELLKKSLPRVYHAADSICLSIDVNRRSWSGKPYEFDNDAFRSWVQSIDVLNKINIYEDNFSVEGLSSIENDNRQRSLMAKYMGPGGWHIQVDSDEYFLDFAGFVSYLRNMIPSPAGNEKPINVCCNWLSIFKKTSNGYLIVDNAKTTWETMPFATNSPEYLNARRNSHFNHISPFFVVHETWARDEEQLKQKMDSWGHDSDFGDKQGYFSFWKNLDKSNYQQVRDFHPLQGNVWNRLRFVEANDVDALIDKLLESNIARFDFRKAWFTNSRNFNRLISVIKKVRKIFSDRNI